MTTALLATLLLASTPARYLSAEGDDAADGCSPETNTGFLIVDGTVPEGYRIR